MKLRTVAENIAYCKLPQRYTVARCYNCIIVDVQHGSDRVIIQLTGHAVFDWLRLPYRIVRAWALHFLLSSRNEGLSGVDRSRQGWVANDSTHPTHPSICIFQDVEYHQEIRFRESMFCSWFPSGDKDRQWMTGTRDHNEWAVALWSAHRWCTFQVRIKCGRRRVNWYDYWSEVRYDDA